MYLGGAGAGFRFEMGQDIDPHRARQVAFGVAGLVDPAHQLVDGYIKRAGDLFQRLPKGLLQRDAGAMP